MLMHTEKIKYGLTFDAIKKAVKICNGKEVGKESAKFMVQVGENFQVRGWINIVNFIKKIPRIRDWKPNSLKALDYMVDRINQLYGHQLASKRNRIRAVKRYWNERIINWMCKFLQYVERCLITRKLEEGEREALKEKRKRNEARKRNWRKKKNLEKLRFDR
jgi:hypothetical protein